MILMANERFNLNAIYELAEQYQEENRKLKEKIKRIDDFYAKEIEDIKNDYESYIDKLLDEINYLKSRALVNPKKITHRQVIEVKELRALGLSYRKIADKTLLGTTTVCRIINGEYD
jgi:hypothetical protein